MLEQAPDKTIMEMLQSYLKKQDLSTRISLIVVLLVLSGGALGAYGVILYFAIEEQQTRYIVMVTLVTLVLCWVLWKVRLFFVYEICIHFFSKSSHQQFDRPTLFGLFVCS